MKERTLRKSLIGLRFEKFVVLDRANNTTYGKIQYVCLCDCGNQFISPSNSIKTGNTKSCGCLRKKVAAKNSKLRGNISGKNNPNYNPFLSDEERKNERNINGYDEWRYKIKELANFTCQICGDKKGGNLVSHHLNSYAVNPEFRLDLNNGVCLCESCHKKFHKLFGYGNNTSKQFSEFVLNFSGERYMFS